MTWIGWVSLVLFFGYWIGVLIWIAWRQWRNS